jgi:hypothetical protein
MFWSVICRSHTLMVSQSIFILEKKIEVLFLALSDEKVP